MSPPSKIGIGICFLPPLRRIFASAGAGRGAGGSTHAFVTLRYGMTRGGLVEQSKTDNVMGDGAIGGVTCSGGNIPQACSAQRCSDPKIDGDKASAVIWHGDSVLGCELY